ncbi:MAG: metal ABC transporter permease [Armatimonadetes bacterium]|nr:metal ABC transporter permease [Armatimonadota bacterium]MDW8122511.1 metal ABC transporter permease [Armatimonadota bacterium]
MPLSAAFVCAVVFCYLGVYVVLRRIVFVSVALTQVGAAGVALGLWLNWAPSALGFASIFLAVLALPLLQQERRLHQESFLGAVYTAASSLALIFVAQSPAEEAHLHHILFGELLTVSPLLVAEMAVIAVLVLVFHLVFFKEILLISFDPDFASSLGLKARTLDLFFYLSLGLTIAVGVRVAGALVVFAYLVLPPLTALLVCQRMVWVFVFSIAIGLFCSAVALYLSFYHLNLPSGPLTAACCALPLLTAALYLLVKRSQPVRHSS